MGRHQPVERSEAALHAGSRRTAQSSGRSRECSTRQPILDFTDCCWRLLPLRHWSVNDSDQPEAVGHGKMLKNCCGRQVRRGATDHSQTSSLLACRRFRAYANLQAEGTSCTVLSSSKPSSNHPQTPPAMIFTGRPKRAKRKAPRAAPLQCGPAQ